MIDFTNCPRTNDTFGGANGSKIGISYKGRTYMLKFPAYARLNEKLSYTNGSISEYLGCHIYQSVGIPAQNTLLGTFRLKNGKVKEVVACEKLDDPENGINLKDFASVKNTIIDSENQGYGTDLYDILDAIDKQTFIDPEKLNDRFWDMFVVDEMIANPDRHNGNWGFIFDSKKDTVRIAPIFDCGSALLPQADEETVSQILSNVQDLKVRIYERPTSAITINGKRINYDSFNREHLQDFPAYARALARIESRINLPEIGHIIEQTPGLTDKQIEFYKTLISGRKKILLDKPLKKAMELGMIPTDTTYDPKPIPGTHHYFPKNHTQSLKNSDHKEVSEKLEDI